MLARTLLLFASWLLLFTPQGLKRGAGKPHMNINGQGHTGRSCRQTFDQ